jgi:hypothetical protein
MVRFSKFALSAAALLLVVTMPVLADQTKGRGLRVADATTDACLSNCATQNQNCQRVCPTTLSTPCISSCDAQAQTCRQGCRK